MNRLPRLWKISEIESWPYRIRISLVLSRREKLKIFCIASLTAVFSFNISLFVRSLTSHAYNSFGTQTEYKIFIRISTLGFPLTFSTELEARKKPFKSSSLEQINLSPDKTVTPRYFHFSTTSINLSFRVKVMSFRWVRCLPKITTFVFLKLYSIHQKSPYSVQISISCCKEERVGASSARSSAYKIAATNKSTM